MTHPIARRYARALFELADEKGLLEQLLQETDDFKRLLDNDDRLRSFLFTPEVSKTSKLEALQSLLKERCSNLFFHFSLLLVRKGRQTHFGEIATELKRLFDLKMKRMRATITTTVPLSPEQIAQLEQQLSHSWEGKVLLENHVNAEILGGIVLQIGGKLIDASLLHQVELLRAQLKQIKLPREIEDE